MSGAATKKIPRLGREYFELAVDFMANPEKYEKLGPLERTRTLSDLLSKLADGKIVRAKDGIYSRFTEMRGTCFAPKGDTSPSFQIEHWGQVRTVFYGRYYNLVTLEEITATTELPIPVWVDPLLLAESAPPPAKKKKACGPSMVIHASRKSGFPEGIMIPPRVAARSGYRQNWHSGNE